VRKAKGTQHTGARAAADSAVRRVSVLFPAELPITEAELQIAETWLSGIIAGLAVAESPMPKSKTNG
jgi:hypothetical protein